MLFLLEIHNRLLRHDDMNKAVRHKPYPSVGINMALVKSSKLRKSFGITDDEVIKIKAFLQGSVYCWIKNKKGEVFAGRDLMGGENFYWEGTPLIALYKKHKILGKSNNDAIVEAGKDMGWILKLVLHEDKRTFESCDAGMAKGYKWDGK